MAGDRSTAQVANTEAAFQGFVIESQSSFFFEKKEVINRVLRVSRIPELQGDLT